MRRITLMTLVIAFFGVTICDCSETSIDPLAKWQAGPQLTPTARMALVNCLNDKKITLYTAVWCGPCKTQKSYFGPEFKHLKNVNWCDQHAGDDPKDDPCKNIKYVPTWKFSDGSKIVGCISLNRLAEKAGCSLKSQRWTYFHDLKFGSCFYLGWFD